MIRCEFKKIGLSDQVNIPAAGCGALRAQLQSKLRSPLLELAMVLDILDDHVPSHSVSDCPGEVSVFPQLATPEPLLEPRELAKQSPPALALDDSHNFPD